jgi:hypothetical protein
MASVPPAPRHHALCICEGCQLAGCGAFGDQPDGSPPFYVLSPRPAGDKGRDPSRRKTAHRPRSCAAPVPHAKR